MTVARFLRETTLGETRWAALDAGDRPLALYLERPTRKVVLGARLEARIGKTEPGAGGTFIDIPGQQGAFLRSNTGQIGTNPDTLLPSEGSVVTVDVVAEARAGKLARVKLAPPGTPPAPSGAVAWRAALRAEPNTPIEDATPGDSLIAAAFEDGLHPDVTLPGGGRLRIERTRALTAADIDSAGRAMKGSAAARALSLNREAAEMLARQILIRGLGGLFVLDCVSPLTKETSAKVREAFLAAWTAITARPARVLVPSALGLMELSTEWRTTPLAEMMLDEAGRPGAEAVALAGLRLLEAEAQRARMARLTLALPEAAYAWLTASGLEAEVQLAAKYGARLTIRVHAGAGPEVSPER
jgi:Ribonuclease G/E